MKRVRLGKSRKGAKKVPAAPKKALKQVDLGAVQERITNLVGNEAMHMVQTTIKEVDKGHYLAMKYLFEMIGLCPTTTANETAQDDSLARTLLRRLQIPEEPDPSAEVTKEVTKDCAIGAAEQESDAIK